VFEASQSTMRTAKATGNQKPGSSVKIGALLKKVIVVLLEKRNKLTDQTLRLQND